MDKISVIVPVYKVEEYLEQCVESLLNQTYNNYEIVLVDDGSPDNCPRMCDQYSDMYENISVIHQENTGLSGARNSGIEWVLNNSDSSWISFVDSDDWVQPQYLELLLLSACKYNSDLAFAKFRYTDDRTKADEKVEDKVYLYDVIDVYSDEKFDPNSVCGRIYKKQMWNSVRFPVGKLHEDRFTSYKLLFRQDKVAVVDAELYNYYMNSNGICRSDWSYRKLDNIIAAEEQIEFFSENELWEAWKITHYQYSKLLINAMKELRNHNPNDKKTYVMLRRKLRFQLNSNGKKLGYDPISDFNIYKYAWPFEMKVLRRLNMLKDRISSK